MDEKKLMKELRQIRNLLILVATKLGASSEQTGAVTGMGAGNIRALIPPAGGARRKKAKEPNPESLDSTVE